jgi:undecaprenyl-diphosphatase
MIVSVRYSHDIEELDLEPIYAVILGVVQGLTEFLPVSSSGHLVLLQHFFGFTEPELLFDISVHCGTLIAVLAVFAREIRSIFRTLIQMPDLLRQHPGFKALFLENEDVRMMTFILVGSVPTGILGLLFKSVVDEIFGTALIAAGMLLVTGTFLWVTRYVKLQGRPLKQMAFSDALVVGLVQGIAILPGISRSGSTISTAMFLGIDRELAGRFSFLLSVPAIVGALMLSLDPSVAQTSLSGGTILIGSAAAFVTGYLSLTVLLRLVKKGRLYWFSPYCWLLGLVSMAYWL